MNIDGSKAVRRAQEIYEERKERAFRRDQIDHQGALQQLWRGLQAEISNLVGHLNRAYGYSLKVGNGEDTLEVRTERATLHLARTGDTIGASFHGQEGPPEKTYTLYFKKSGERSHTPEWRASEKDKGLASEDLADNLVLELLNGDYEAERAGEG